MIYQAHPFRFGMKITNVKYLDGIEVCNRNIEHDSHNDIAALWAEKFGLKKTAGSDHHQKGNEGLAGIISRREITSNKILLDTLANQDYTLYEKSSEISLRAFYYYLVGLTPAGRFGILS